MSEIMHTQEDVTIVKISQRFELSNNTLEMFIANFSGDEIELLHTDMHYSSANFRLSHRQMDDLFTAWQAYKADQQAKAEAEEKRLAAVEAEAYQLIESCKPVHIEKKQDCWLVTIPYTGWDSGELYHADTLLMEVKEAIAYCEPIREAHRLAKDYPMINFNHQAGTTIWHITINDLFGEWANRDTILERTQQAIARYEQYTATQAQ